MTHLCTAERHPLSRFFNADVARFFNSQIVNKMSLCILQKSKKPIISGLFNKFK